MNPNSILETIFEASTAGSSDILTSMLKVALALTGLNLANAERNGLLPLIEASSAGHPDTVQILLNHGAQVDAMDKREMSALIAASVKGHTEVIKILLAHGASVDLQGKSDGKSALNAASTEGKVESAKTLLECGANVDLEDINGWSPLFVATRNNNFEVVKVLLEGGADPNVKDITGMCPIIRACTLGYKKIVKVLLAHGAQVDIQDSEGSSPLNMASFLGHTEIVSILLEHGAQVNLENNIRQTPLLSASFSGHAEIATILLKSGAKDDRLSSLLIAILLDQHEIVQLFVDCGSQVHPAAKLVARHLTKIELLKLMINNASTLLPALEKALESSSEASLEQKTKDEVMKVQQMILETVTDIHFKSMSQCRGISYMTSSLSTGEDTLTLSVLLGEFMALNLAADWQNIGVLLDLPSYELDAVKHDNPRAINCTREMLDKWLKTVNPSPSWERLVEAVEIMDQDKAETLRKKYCS